MSQVNLLEMVKKKERLSNVSGSDDARGIFGQDERYSERDSGKVRW